MKPRSLLSYALPAGLLSAFLGLVFLPAHAADPISSSGRARAMRPRGEEIADIERQIADLTKRLETLKKAPAPTRSPGVEPALPPAWTTALHWRCIGPASMGGRIVAFSVFEADPSTFWVATASGGLLKTTNNGVTFEHQFDREATVSVGDVCVAPSDRNVVWVGTGENNPRNSVSYGDGVYKSTDGGKTWRNMGLPNAFQVGKVVVHPKNPDIVYVGVLGRLYGESAERGLYKTTDGGKTWKHVLFIDNKTGVIDIRMNPQDPETLLVAAWDRQRDGYDSLAGSLSGSPVDQPLADGYDAYDPARKWGPGGGIYKSTDGFKTYKKLKNGLPGCSTGRIGLDYYRKDPKVVFAIIDSERIGQGRVPAYLGVRAADGPGGPVLREITPNSPASRAGLKAGDVVQDVTAGPGKPKTPVTTTDRFYDLIGGQKPGDKLTFTVLRDKKAKSIEVTLGQRAGQLAPVNVGFRGADSPNGVRVTGLPPRGGAAASGLQAGDVITAVGKQKVATLEQVQAAFGAAAAGSKLAVKVLRDGKAVDLSVPVPARRRQSESRPYGFLYGGQRENVQGQQGPDGQQYGGVYRSADGGETWARVNSVNPRPMYFSQVRVDPSDEKYVYVLGVSLYRSENGGKTFTSAGSAGIHPDQHALWIDPRDGRHMLIGTDGGTYASYDRGSKWDYLNNMAVGQFYHVAVDNRRPYRVYGGLQDNGSWGGPSHSLDGRGPVNADWVMVQGGDGFYCQVDPTDPDIVYAESQEGNMRRTNLKTGAGASIKPRAPAGQPPYRFNWNTPMLLSRHNPQIFYSAGNYLFRSLARGDNPRPVSPELPRTSQGSATCIGESPRNAQVLWAGTDDGNLWVSRDGGVKWDMVAGKVGLPKPYWVASVEPSRFAEGRCYVCFDAHRSDDDQPHVYVTQDYGQTWKPLRGNLPAGSSRVLREDLYNEDVLYLGTEFAAWASIDRGATWTKINNNLPTVAVHEFAQHPTAGEMVAATHGRSLWVLDVTPLRQLKPAMTKAAASLLAPNNAIHWRREMPRGTVYGSGSREYFGENPLPGAQVYYALTKKAAKVQLVVNDYAGKRVASLPVRNEPGLHRSAWNLRGQATALGVDAFQPAAAGGGRGRGGLARPGQYRVVLTVDGTEYAQGLRVENDPTLPQRAVIAEDEAAPRRRRDIDY